MDKEQIIDGLKFTIGTTVVEKVRLDVIAWMPLPPCYDPQESEDKECTKKI